MSTINPEKLGIVGKTVSEKSPALGINTSSESTESSKCFKKPYYDPEGKDSVNIPKIPRHPMTTSYSFNETIKSNRSKGKTKKAPSMIPRSKSRKQNESDKIRIDIPSKTESLKRYFGECSDSCKKESGEAPAGYEFELIMQRSDKPRKPSVTEEQENKFLERKLEVSSSLKPSPNIVKDNSTGLDPATQEEEIKGSRLHEKFGMDGDMPEGGRKARTIRHLYEMMKCTSVPLFESFKWFDAEKFKGGEFEISCSDPKMPAAVDGNESVPDSSSIQEHYDFTLGEILKVWKSAISLFSSVKSDAVTFVEENDKLIDEEQLILESEILQAAFDFGVSYSKLKTELLIKHVKRRLNVNCLETRKLENLLDSKVVPTLYNIDDLATMAQHFDDVSATLLKSED